MSRTNNKSCQLKSHSHLPSGEYCTHIYASFTCVSKSFLCVNFIMALINCTSVSYLRHTVSRYFLVPRLGLGIACIRHFWHDSCYHPTTATTKSGLLHLYMLSLLLLEVPRFLFAYFTIALKQGVNEVTNIILFTLCLLQLILSATILRG